MAKGKGGNKAAKRANGTAESGKQQDEVPTVSRCMCHNARLDACSSCADVSSPDVMQLAKTDVISMPRTELEAAVKTITCPVCLKAALEAIAAVDEVFMPVEMTQSSEQTTETETGKAKKKKKGHAEQREKEEEKVAKSEPRSSTSAEEQAIEQAKAADEAKYTRAKREGRWLTRISKDEKELRYRLSTNQREDPAEGHDSRVGFKLTLGPEAAEDSNEESKQSENLKPQVSELAAKGYNLDAVVNGYSQVPALEPVSPWDVMESSSSISERSTLIRLCKARIPNDQTIAKVSGERSQFLKTRDALNQRVLVLLTLNLGAGFILGANDGTDKWFENSNEEPHFFKELLQHGPRAYLQLGDEILDLMIDLWNQADSAVRLLIDQCNEDTSCGRILPETARGILVQLENFVVEVASTFQGIMSNHLLRYAEPSERERNVKLLHMCTKIASVANRIELAKFGDESSAFPAMTLDAERPLLVSYITIMTRLLMILRLGEISLDKTRQLDDLLCTQGARQYVNFDLKMCSPPALLYFKKPHLPEEIAKASFTLGHDARALSKLVRCFKIRDEDLIAFEEYARPRAWAARLFRRAFDEKDASTQVGPKGKIPALPKDDLANIIIQDIRNVIKSESVEMNALKQKWKKIVEVKELGKGIVVFKEESFMDGILGLGLFIQNRDDWLKGTAERIIFVDNLIPAGCEDDLQRFFDACNDVMKHCKEVQKIIAADNDVVATAAAEKGDLTKLEAVFLTFRPAKMRMNAYLLWTVLSLNNIASSILVDPAHGCARSATSPAAAKEQAQRAVGRLLTRLLSPKVTELVQLSSLMKSHDAEAEKEKRKREQEEKKKAEDREREAQKRAAEEAKKKQKEREQAEREENERREREERELKEAEQKRRKAEEQAKKEWEEQEKYQSFLAELAASADDVSRGPSIPGAAMLKGGRRERPKQPPAPPAPAQHPRQTPVAAHPQSTGAPTGNNINSAKRQAPTAPVQTVVSQPPVKKSAPVAAHSRMKKWACPSCTFENEPSDTKCIICLSEPATVEPVSVRPAPVVEESVSVEEVLVEQSNDVPSTVSKGPVGLSNEAGENSCFLNVVVQSLWHLRTFSQAFVQETPGDHACGRVVGESCLVCSLRQTFRNLEASQDSLVSSVEMRRALAAAFGGIFSLGEKEDAAEAFESVLSILHKALTHEDEQSDEFLCKCLVHAKLGSRFVEGIVCPRCKKSIESNTFDGVSNRKHLEAYTRFGLFNVQSFPSFVRYVPASLIAALDGPFQDRLNQAMDLEPVSCNCCDKKNLYIDRIMTKLPSVYTVCVVWSSHKAPLMEIKAFLGSISEQLDVTAVEGAVKFNAPDEIVPKYSVLRGMMCYYGSHYAAFFRPAKDTNPDNLWYMFDDSVVKPISRNWVDAARACLMNRFQPVALFYETDASLTEDQCTFLGTKL